MTSKAFITFVIAATRSFVLGFSYKAHRVTILFYLNPKLNNKGLMHKTIKHGISFFYLSCSCTFIFFKKMARRLCSTLDDQNLSNCVRIKSWLISIFKANRKCQSLCNNNGFCLMRCLIVIISVSKLYVIDELTDLY